VEISNDSEKRVSGVQGHRMKRSVVVPVYGNEATLPELLKQIAALPHLWKGPFEVIFVIDGSPDNSFAYLKTHLPGMPFSSQLVNLSRNFGAFAAVRAGLSLATGDVVAVLAADLQQPVGSVTQFFEALDRGLTSSSVSVHRAAILRCHGSRPLCSGGSTATSCSPRYHLAVSTPSAAPVRFETFWCRSLKPTARSSGCCSGWDSGVRL
jgi:glycosyltransferase involved in cell wall biosynthesis